MPNLSSQRLKKLDSLSNEISLRKPQRLSFDLVIVFECSLDLQLFDRMNCYLERITFVSMIDLLMQILAEEKGGRVKESDFFFSGNMLSLKFFIFSEIDKYHRAVSQCQ